MGLFTDGHAVWEVRGFHPARQPAKFSPPNMPSILNLFRISSCGEGVNYRPYASTSFEVVKPHKITAISAIIIILLLLLVSKNSSH